MLVKTYYQYLKKPLTRVVSSSRRNIVIKFIARACKEFLLAYENAWFDPEVDGEKYVLETIAKSGPFNYILDVGANEGQWASMAAKIFPSAQIHSFEIIPETAELMKEKTLNTNIIVNSLGLADKNGLLEVKHFPNATVSTTLITEQKFGSNPYIKEFEIRQVEIITGDSYVKQNNLDRINFLKIDVEGAENLVLFGFQETLAAEKIDIIQFEYSWRANINVNFLLKNFYDFLEPFGFSIGRIYPNYVNFKDYIFSDEGVGGGNYLAVHESKADLIKLLSK